MSEKRALKWTIVVLSIVIYANAFSIQNEPVSRKVIKGEPIVINTEAQHYQNPTLGEYQLCTQSRDDCIKECGNSSEDCTKTCQICPILIDREVLVQGINDTLYRLPIASTKSNHTNIIRLTNEIRNIIETSQGNITANSQNNINVYQNRSSRFGGKFSLGYSENDPCCLVLVSNRCQQSFDGPSCSYRIQRTCGSQCISKVVRAKRTISCSETNPADCSQTKKYVPQRLAHGCRVLSELPFISCKPIKRVANDNTKCSECYNIPYARVLKGQVPKECQKCFDRVGSQPAPQAPQPYVTYQQSYQPYCRNYRVHQPYWPYQYYQPYPSPLPAMEQNFGNGWTILDDDMTDDQMPDASNGWELEETGCINEDGSIKVNCVVDSANEDGPPQSVDYDGGDEDGSDNADGLDH